MRLATAAHSRIARSKPRRLATPVSGSSSASLLRLGELRLQGVDAPRHLHEQHVVAPLLLDDDVLELLGFGGDAPLQLADVVDVGQTVDAVGRLHQVDVERLGLAGEVGERVAQDLDQRGQLLLALGERAARLGEVGVAEREDLVDRVGDVVEVRPSPCSVLRSRSTRVPKSAVRGAFGSADQADDRSEDRIEDLDQAAAASAAARRDSGRARWDEWS